MPLTLNQIVKRIESLALAHHQINHFYFGDVPEFDANGDIVYPGVFLEMLPGTVDRAAHQKRFNFRIFFLDLVKVSDDTEANETEVLSDMDGVATDMLAMLMSSQYQEDWLIIESAAISPLTESLGDMVAGVSAEVGIIVDFLADSCVVPTDETVFNETFDMARTKIYTYTAAGLTGSSFAVADIINKHVLAVFRAGFYKRAVAVAPTDSEKVQVGTVDLGTGKGILGDGTVILETGDSLINDEKMDFLVYA